jgi:23S rRNA (uridine2552-2'-O)-methyltransferase
LSSCAAQCQAISRAWYGFATPSSSRPVARYRRKDHFHQRAKREGFRSRAVYKLAELQQDHRILGRGQRVVDLGCWPGGWLQEASRAVGARGRVVGVDLAPIEPPLKNENVFSFVGDIEDPSICEQILTYLEAPCDVLLSDAAPKLTGVREVDRAAEERLLVAVENLIPLLLRPDGSLLVKLLECPEAQAFQRRIRLSFAAAKPVRAGATRKGSTERYLLLRGYRPTEIDE